MGKIYIDLYLKPEDEDSEFTDFPRIKVGFAMPKAKCQDGSFVQGTFVQEYCWIAKVMEACEGGDKTEQAANDQLQPIESKTTTSGSMIPNIDKSENGIQKKNSTPKGKKRKKTVRDQTAPRQPLTGYIRFLNDRRDTVRNENPNMSFAELTKLLANEWMNLPSDEKQQYLDAAEQDRERYLQELNAYKKTEAYRLFTQKQASKKQKEELQDDQEVPEKENEHLFTGFDIPIFTEEFLDHNKAREAELRQLRKSNTDYEQQNAILQKHMENMRAAVDRLAADTQQQRAVNIVLKDHLTQVRTTLVAGFSALPLPGTKVTANLQNIDSYMSELHSILMDPNNTNLAFTNAAREIASKLEFNDKL